MKIGEKLKEEREKNKLSQKDVADRLHVARQSVSRWETDQSYPDLENLMALGQLYHVSIDELLGIEREEVIPESAEKKTVEEEEDKPVKRAELDWKEQGMVLPLLLRPVCFLCWGCSFRECFFGNIGERKWGYC